MRRMIPEVVKSKTSNEQLGGQRLLGGSMVYEWMLEFSFLYQCLMTFLGVRMVGIWRNAAITNVLLDYG
jgi:hypothetical protein